MGPDRQAEDEASVRSWQRYRLISDNSTDVIYETDLNGIIQWISPSVQDLLGWDPAQLQGHPARDLVHPIDAERLESLRTALYLEGRPHDDVTCMVSTASGGYREVTVRIRPLLDTDNAVTGTLVTVVDTHDRDSALRALATLSQANHAMVRATDEADLLQRMCDTIVRAGRYLFVWYGRPIDDADQSVLPVAQAGEHQGYLDEIRVSWGDNPLGRGPTGRCIRSRQTQVENNFTPDPEYRPWLGAATRRGFKSSIVLPVIVDGDLDGALMVYAAEVGTFDALAQDLLEDLAADLGYGIERLRANEDLKRTTRQEHEQRQRLQATLDSQFDPFVLLAGVRDDAGQLVDLRWVEANAAAVVYNQVPREQLIGARLLDLFPGQLEHGPLRQYFHAIETGEPVILDDYAYGHEVIGTERRYDIRAVRSGDAIALTWRDVTDRHVAAQQLADSERRYRLLAENASDVILLSDQGMNLTWVSSSAFQAFGLTPESIVGHGATDYIHPDDIGGLRSAVEHSRITGEPIRVRYRWRCDDGSYRWVEAMGRPIDDDGTGRPGRVVSQRIIEDQVRAEQDLAAREERYRLLAENASDIVWQVEPDGTLSWTSPSITRILGWQPEELHGRIAMELVHPDDRDLAIRSRLEVLAGRAFQGEFRILGSDGTPRWMSLTSHPVQTEAGIVRILSLRDIEDEVTARLKLEFALGHDQITGLPTRQGMLGRLDFMRPQLVHGHVMAVLCIGIDALSEINEALTHAVGDIVITTVAARIAAAAESPDLVGRGSGDEFLMILSDLANGADAVAAAERVRIAVQGPVTVGEQSIAPTVSIGIATGGPGIGSEQLLRDASLALRKAKNNGRDRSEFADPGLAVEAQHRLTLEAEIREGLHNGEFVPWFQPIVSLATEELVGYEALVRWVRPDGNREPASFVPVAESTALITELDAAVLRQSVAVLAQLPDPLFVAVNVTAATLARTQYAAAVEQALADFGADARRLHIEVTETMLLNLTDAVPEAMHRLARLGVHWYVDDFGTGYSSISHLRDLPVSGLKLDQSFTFGIGANDTTSIRLADALIGLANGLGLDTVAEGVETRAEADYLRTIGWRHGQGWLFGRAAPLPLG